MLTFLVPLMQQKEIAANPMLTRAPKTRTPIITVNQQNHVSRNQSLSLSDSFLLPFMV